MRNNNFSPQMPLQPQPQPPPEYAEHLPLGGPYFSPPAPMGSLGTPKIGARLRGSPSGSYNSKRSTRRSTPGSCYTNDNNTNNIMDTTNVVIVATRPLLKTLARECRPFPPWCVGYTVPEDATEELKLFSSFLRATPEEIMCTESAFRLSTKVMQSVWPNVELKPMSTTAAGLSSLKEVTLHYYAKNSPVEPEELEIIQKKIQDIANDHAVQVEFNTDYRDVTCAVLTDLQTGKRFSIRYGLNASNAEVSSIIFQTILAPNPEYHATLTLLDALLRQNKILDDTGTNKEFLNGEALAIMLVSIINSYDSSDSPNAGRLMMDFFLTYGFSANFDLVNNSISIQGMKQPPPKVHRNAQISILDPFDETKNITPKLEKGPHLQAVFNYCYTALSQFTQVSQRQRRAQSILSTVIGGETYWGRVLQLYREGISPFVEVVNEKKHILAQAL